jgi:hypothetical protein
MKKIPYTIHDVLGFKLYAYENRFHGHIKTKIELADQFCQLSLIKMSLIIKKTYRGSIFPFRLLDDWNFIHKANDYAIYDIQNGNALFYIVDQQDMFDILATPMQFNYGYKILYDVAKERKGIPTPNIDTIKNFGWKSLDEIKGNDFMEPLALWESYPVEVRKDIRGTNNESYYFMKDKKVTKIQAKSA